MTDTVDQAERDYADKSGIRAVASDAARRHHVTIMFCDLSSSTRIAAALEPEAYAALLEAMRALAAKVIGRHGGTIVRIDGDGLACMFGYPEVHEDAARRATEAALDLHGAAQSIGDGIEGANLPIRFHTGIHAGVVLVRPGDVVRGRYEMLGDPTNVAARIADAAQADEILVSDAALGVDSAFFETRPRKVRIAGRSQPLAVHAITGRAAVRTRFDARARRGETLLVGRVAELAALEAAYAAVPPRTVGIAALIGSAGIGKTRLANAFAARARALGAVTVQGSCEAYLAAPPLQPFRQIAEALNGDGSSAGVGLVSALQGAAASPAQRRPLIMLIDDWQWADDASQNLLASLLAIPTTGQVFVLLSSRNRDALPPLPDAATITLPPLDAAAALQAASALLPAETPFLHDNLVAAAGGNPLFLEELCHAQARGGDSGLGSDPNAWMDMLVEARVATLDADHARLVRIAAVIGNTVPMSLFKALTGLDEDAVQLANLSDADFLYASDLPGIWRFKHGITRDAIYRTVNLDERRAWHRAIVQALEADPATNIDALAYHSEQAGDRDRAGAFALTAGDRAMEVNALDRAQVHYRSALDKLDDSIPEPRLLTRLVHKFGHASVVDPAREQLDVLENGAALAAVQGNDEARALALYWQGALLYGLGATRLSIAALSEALTIAESLGHARLVVQIIANLGQSYLGDCDYERGAPLVEEAIRAMRGWNTTRTPTGLAYTLGCKAFMLADLGEFSVADELAAEADALIGAAGPAMLGSHLSKRTATAIWREDFETAVELADRGLAHDARTHSRFNTMMAQSLKAYALWRIERDPRHIDSLEQFTAWFTASDNHHRVSLCYGWLADACANAGRHSDTRKYAAAAFLRAREGDSLGFCPAARAMAQQSAKLDRKGTSARYLAMARRAAEARGSRREQAMNDRCEAKLADAVGNNERAKTLSLRASDAFAAMGLPQPTPPSGASR